MKASIVICGAGIAGISAAYHLAQAGARDVLIIDERAPLTLTSDKSTECYRNWWSGPDDAMVQLINRSVAIMDDLARASDNVFHLNRRGYLYVTADSARVAEFIRAGEQAAQYGAGALRVHGNLSLRGAIFPGTARQSRCATKQSPTSESGTLAPHASAGVTTYQPAPATGFENQPDGADLILDPALIHKHFPYLSERIVAVLHARRCGWLSAQQLGMYMLEQARARGVKFLSARVEAVEVREGAVRGVRLRDGTTIATDCFVNAAGPFLKSVARMIGVELPVFSELHQKISFNDELGAVPRDAPLLIWSDPQTLPWTDEERAMLAESDELRGLLNEFPTGAHVRPEGGAHSRIALMLWAYHTPRVAEIFPPPFDPLYSQVVLRGMSAVLPSLRAYFDRPPKPMIDGGYYTKTRENRPLIGALPVRGAFVIGALSGFGVMASCAAGELVANHVLGNQLPSYAHAFEPARYEDAEYRARLESWNETGQL